VPAERGRPGTARPCPAVPGRPGAVATTYQQAAYPAAEFAPDGGRPQGPSTAAPRPLADDDRAIREMDAETLRLQGHHADAAKEFDRLLARDPDNPWLVGSPGGAARGGAGTGHHGRCGPGPRDRPRLARAPLSWSSRVARVALELGDAEGARRYCDRALGHRQPAARPPIALRARAERIRWFGLTPPHSTAVRLARVLAPQDPHLFAGSTPLWKRDAGDLTRAVEPLALLVGLPSATPEDDRDPGRNCSLATGKPPGGRRVSPSRL